ncbi:hypothetical protein OHC33_006628 [Knufia fluminis]|uniref:Beta-xylosidase C-terminal Concanavalin A-like domain-containing protein n=2 Tax=Knufia TaxID=430999 RepID=A0AAN8ELG6_9EURO|nr:hypothetical protein OHC33_006628 [Knufia fluminis]
MAVAQTFTNPVIWEDLADVEVIRVEDAFYMTASTMHYSPGAPVLKSYDLAHWQYIGHSVPSLDFGIGNFSLEDNTRAYVNGIWASSLQYRESTQLYYWIGCIHGVDTTYVYTAPAAEGPWTRHSEIDKCYYDVGLLFDDKDDVYLAYGNTNISVAQLNSDLTRELSSQHVFTTPEEIETLEGSRFYEINGTYYLFLTRPPDSQFIVRSSGGPFGPYDQIRPVADNVTAPIEGAGAPHQGGLLQTQNGDWLYMAFIDAYPGGRSPVLAPITWSHDGWPVLETAPDGSWAREYPLPLPVHPLEPYNPDNFTSLDPVWEWNHNPDPTGYSTGDDGLILRTVSVTDDLYQARNTLVHRIPGPDANATIELDIANMVNGDRAGLAMLRDESAYIAVLKDADTGANRILMYDGLSISREDNWATNSTGSQIDSVELEGDRVWLRAYADIRTADCDTCGIARFYYSFDGTTFEQLGSTKKLSTDWPFFMGYRFAVFNYATVELGGEVAVKSFTLG